MAQKILFTFTAQDVGVAAAQDKIKDRQRAINKEIKEAKAIGSPYKQLLGESVELRREAQKLREEQNRLNKEFKATTVPKDSLAGLRLEYDKLVNSINKLSQAERNSDFGKKLISSAAYTKSQINSMEEAVGRFTGSVGNYRKGLLSIGDIVTGGLITGGAVALFSGLDRLKDEILDINAAIADSQADVAKAANVSIQAIQNLSDRLETRQTRTSLLDQLGIAEIGAKLGVAEKDLFGFVEAVDVVNVALGDQFGGGVEQTTSVIGKLRNVLLDIKSDNIGNDIVNIGNALNFLEAQGPASAGAIADITTRIAGVGQVSGVSSGKLIGVASTIDELGINAERGSTAFVRLLKRVGESPDAFAKAIGESAPEFTKLVNEDIFGATTKFIEKLNDKGLSNTQLARVFKDLKLNGVGVSELVGKLGGNIGLLSTRVEQATASLKSNDSVLQEFQKKNDTLGSSVEVLQNKLKNLFSSGEVQGSLKAYINLLSDAVGLITSFVSTPLSQKLREQQIEFNALIGVLENTTTKEAERNRVIGVLKDQYPDYLKFVNDDASGQIDLAKTLAYGNQLFEQRILLQATEEQRIELTKRKLKAEQELTKALIEQEKVTKRTAEGQNQAAGRGRIIRSEAGDVGAAESVSAVAQRNVFVLRKEVEQLDAAIADLLNIADETAKRKFDGKSLDDLAEKIESAGNAAGGDGGGSGGGDGGDKKGAKDKIKFLAGSIGFLKEQIEKLNKEIEKTPPSTGLLPGLVSQLKQAELELSRIESRISDLKNPIVEKTDDQKALEQLGYNPKGAEADAKALRDRLGAILGGQILGPDDPGFTDEDERRAAREKELFEKSQKNLESEEDEQKKLQRAIIDGAIQSAQTIADTVFGIQKESLERQQRLKFEQLDREEQAELEKAKGNAKKEALIRKDFEKRREELEKEGARKRKEIARKEALINIALSITKALTGAPPPFNFVLAGVAAIAGAAQLAAIEAQEFAFGGKVKRLKPGKVAERQNAPRTANGDTVLAYLKPGEMVLNELQQAKIQRMAGPNVFEYAGVPGPGKGSATPVPFFASGGVVDFVPQTSFANSNNGNVALNAQATFSPEQIRGLAVVLADTMADTVATEVRMALALGLNDSNRRLEREQELSVNRQG